MKNFILGCITMLLLSFTAIENKLLEVKPAIPKKIIIIDGGKLTDYNMSKKINNFINKGYTIKTIYKVNYNTKILMEKY